MSWSNLGHVFSAETVEACALIGLHMMAAENALRSDSDTSRDLGDMCGAATALNGPEEGADGPQ